MMDDAAPNQSHPAILPPPNQITVLASHDDVRSAMWISHKWTRRLVVGGGSVLVSAILSAAGLWANASLEAQRGMRSEVAAIRVDMAGVSKDLSALAVANKARELEHQDYERRIQRLESRELLLERYDRALTNYEERHGLSTERLANETTR